MSMADHIAAARAALDLPLLSPSAPYDLERMARERAASAPWWTVYPEGQCAAAIFRLWQRLGMPLKCHDPEFRALLEAEDSAEGREETDLPNDLIDQGIAIGRQARQAEIDSLKEAVRITYATNESLIGELLSRRGKPQTKPWWRPW